MRELRSVTVAVAVVAAALASGLPGPSGSAHATSLNGWHIVVDAGHGGTDRGDTGFGLAEADAVLDLARRARDLLREEGATVLMTRDCDCTVTTAARLGTVNASGADLVISLHAASCGGCGASGVAAYHADGDATGAAAAALVTDEIADHFNVPVIGVGTTTAPIVHDTAVPGVTVDVAYIDHAADNAKLASAAWRDRAAHGLLHAVHRHAGVAPHDPVTGTGPLEVRVVDPVSGTWSSGLVTVQASVSDADAVAWLRALVDDTVVADVTAAPHAFTWDSRTVPDGTHFVTVEGEAKNGGYARATITVPVDNQAPTAEIRRPLDGSVTVADFMVSTAGVGPTVVAGRATVRVDVEDAGGSGLAQLEFLVDGETRAVLAAPPWHWEWNAGNEGLGAHTLTVVARDRAGNTGTDAVTVDAVLPGI